jgi:hypothetical protein
MRRTKEDRGSRYAGDPAAEIGAGRPAKYYDYVEATYGAAFRAGTHDGMETFCELYRQVAAVGNRHSTDAFIDRFVPLLPIAARRTILNRVLDKSGDKGRPA